MSAQRDFTIRPDPLAPPDDEPIEGPENERAVATGRVAAPKLYRRMITLEDGHEVGLAVSGQGMPLVVVHGFSGEGFLYAQTLSRLVSMGFRVIAIDTAGHGATQGLPTSGANLRDYTKLLGEVVQQLGIKRAMFAGHSMGGRLVVQHARMHPQRVIALLPIDAIIGDTWDRLVNVSRVSPPVLVGLGGLLAVDTVLTLPVFRDPEQANKLWRLLLPTVIGHVRRPWRLVGPMVSILRSQSSRSMLDHIGDHHIPTFVIHGDRDLPVPVSTARSAAQRTEGHLVIVHGAKHSWLLNDPETLPAIMAELLRGPLGQAYRDAIVDAGRDPDEVTIDDMDALFYEPGAPILDLTPPLEFHKTGNIRRNPSFTWTVTDFRRSSPE